MAGDFDGKVALVTGAGGGLGRCHAEYLARHGARVVVNDLGGGPRGVSEETIDDDMAERTAAGIRDAGGEAIPNNASVAEFENAQNMVKQAVDTWGRIDIVVNSAGIASAQIWPDVGLDDMRRQLNVGVMGIVNTMRAAWPHMLEQKFGRIVNTASAACFGIPTISYASMKSGVLGLTKAVAIFARPHNININVLLPAAWTRLTAQTPPSDFRDRLERDFTPEKTSPLVGYLCHERCEITSEVFSAGGGRFSRVVFAATPSAAIDDSLESVANAMPDVLAGNALNILNSTDDDMVNLGFPPEECANSTVG